MLTVNLADRYCRNTDPCEITVRVWYPSDGAGEACTAPYYEKAEEIVPRFGYPSALLNLNTNSKLEIPVSQQEDMYPVLLFNHGWGEHAAQGFSIPKAQGSGKYSRSRASRR